MKYLSFWITMGLLKNGSLVALIQLPAEICKNKCA